MATGTTFRILPSADGRYYGLYPDGDAPLSLDAVKSYVFGHSLFTYDAGVAPVSDWTRAGTWLGLFAQESSTNYNGQGDFGQITDLNTYWSNRALGFGGDGQPRLDVTGAPEPSFDSPGYVYTSNNTPDWSSGSWENEAWTHIYTMASNFEQTDQTPTQYRDRVQTQINNCVAYLPSSTYINYIHWQEPSIQPVPPADVTNMTSGEAQTYRDYLRGDYLDWFVELQDLTVAANPLLGYVSVPAGPVWADLWENEIYMQGLNSGVFFGDTEPHGTETMYFIVGLICYRAAYLQNPDLTSFVPPVGSSVNSAVLNNLPAIVSYIETRLNHYNNNGVRVYL